MIHPAPAVMANDASRTHDCNRAIGHVAQVAMRCRSHFVAIIRTYQSGSILAIMPMRFGAPGMRLGSPTHILSIFLCSVVAGLGLGLLVVGGISDIFGLAGQAIVASNFVIPVLIAATFLLGLVCSSDRIPRSLGWLRHPKIRWIAVGSLATAGIALFVAGVDGANTSAWRTASHLTAGQGVNKQQLREFGRQFARLSGHLSSSGNQVFGAVAVDWRVWLVGGRADVLLRSGVSAPSTGGAECDASGEIRLVAASQEAVLNETSASFRDVCGQWNLIQVELPRGLTEVRFMLDGLNRTGETALDIMLAANRPNYAWFWNLCSLIGIGLVLAIVFLLSVNLRSDSGSRLHRAAQSHGKARRRGVFTVGAIVLFALVSNAFIYWYVSQEKTIYTWDYSGYWTSSRNVSEFLRGAERKTTTQQALSSQGPRVETATNEPGTTMPDPRALPALIRNIRFTEYNVSSNMPVAIVMAAFGGSRMVYELSLVNIYALAAVLMLIVTVGALGRDDSARWPVWWPILPVLAVVCFVPFWIPIVRGYMGVSVAACNLAVFWLYFRQPAREISTTSLSIIGALLLAGVILQRWNAYWVVGFLAMAFADSTWQLIERRQFSLLEILRSLRAPIVSGFAAFALFAAVAWPKIQRTVTTDYADLYSAFQEDDGIFSALTRQVDAFGAGIYTLFLISFVFLITGKSTRRVALLLGLQLVCGFFLFSRTQTMGPHQYFILLPGMLVLLSLGLTTGIGSQRRPVFLGSISAAALVLILGLGSAYSVFVPTEPGVGVPSTSRLLSQSYRPPLVNNDLDEFLRLAEYVDELMVDVPNEEGIYVLSGSATLNANHLKTITVSTGAPFNSADRILGSSVVDKRDGFPGDIFRAHILISSDPVQLSRRPSDQQVIRIPADRLFSGGGIGAAFEQLPARFRLDGGVDAVVFRRNRPNTTEEIAELSEALREFYPNRPHVYQ